MSEITGTQFGEGFKMRVVSGMLVGGSLKVSWATGERASSKLWWGTGSQQLRQTPIYNSQPKAMVRYHELYFPETYLDTLHYFRVESVSRSGKRGISPIYSVYVTNNMELTCLLPRPKPSWNQASVASESTPSPLALTTDAHWGIPHTDHQQLLSSSSAAVATPPTQSSPSNQSIGTTFNVTIT